MVDPEEHVKLQLNQLRDDFIRSVPQRLSEIEAILAELSSGFDLNYYELLLRKVHNLVGSSGCFGFNKLSNKARELESYLRILVDQRNNHLSLPFERIRSYLFSVRSCTNLVEASDTNLELPQLTRLNVEPLNILVANDDPYSCELLAITLKKGDHKINVTTNGKDAVEQFKNNPTDLIIMDVVMPEMNGYETAKAIKEYAGDNFVPIIFLTSLCDEVELAQCIENGGDDFLIKPFNHVSLNAKIFALDRIRRMYQKAVG